MQCLCRKIAALCDAKDHGYAGMRAIRISSRLIDHRFITVATRSCFNCLCVYFEDDNVSYFESSIKYHNSSNTHFGFWPKSVPVVIAPKKSQARTRFSKVCEKMADVSLDEVIRQRRINVKAAAKRYFLSVGRLVHVCLLRISKLVVTFLSAYRKLSAACSYSTVVS